MANRSLRTTNYLKALISANYRQATGSWAGGKNVYDISFGGTPTARTDLRRTWSENGKWSGNDAEFVLEGVPRSWLDTVLDRGMSILDGLVTLKAQKLPTTAGAGLWHVETYKATWIEQSRGLSIRAVSGWIAKAEYRGERTLDAHEQYYSYHSLKSPEDARRGVRRRLAQLSPPTERPRLVDVWLDSGSVPDNKAQIRVAVEHSLDAGNCESGTRSFCARYLGGKESCTLQELVGVVREIICTPSAFLPADHKGMRRDVRRAIIKALRADRRQRRAQAQTESVAS